MMTVDELLDSAASHARAVLIGEKGAQLLPTWVLQFKDPRKPTTIIATPWGGEQEKAMVFDVMRGMVRAEANVYSFMSECWMAHETRGAARSLMPSEREDKIEVVMINACDRKEGKMLMLEMIRGPDGVVTELKPQEDQATHFEGRAANFLVDE